MNEQGQANEGDIRDFSFVHLTTWRLRHSRDPSSWQSSDVGSLLGLVFIFNALDAIATLAWIFKGTATEANPLMEWLISLHPVVFVVFKLTLVGLGSVLLYRFRHNRLARWASYGLFCLFSLLLIYHIIGGMLFE